MPKPLDKTIAPEDENKRPTTDNAELSDLNSPDVDPNTGKARNKAISSFKQAHTIAKRHFDKAKEGRLKTAAVVMDKYGGSAPYKMVDLRATGQLWRNNFSTNPLGSTVDRSTPQFIDPLKQAECLTYSALKANTPDAAEKTRKFRSRTTKLIRSWKGWISFLSHVVQDNYLHGGSAPAWIDDDWRPKAFRTDESFLPEGSGQHASELPFSIYRQPILLHTFLRKLEDKQVAEDAGYHWDGCVKAANESAGLRAQGDMTQLEQLDAMRENGALGFTYEGDMKVVWVFHVLVQEYDGTVNLWTVAQHGGHGIRFVENIHEGMEDGTTLFTIQEGNQKFYGSKGAGRLLTNLHISIDRGRNLAQDQVYLAGLPIVTAAAADMNKIQPVIRHPFILLPKEATVVKEAVGFEWEGFKWMDDKLTRIMSDIAGAFIPTDLSSADSGSTTKIEAAENAARQLAVKNGVLGRFFTHFADLIGSMQRKIYKPENLKEGLRIFEENQEKRGKGIRVLARKFWKWLKETLGEEKTAAMEPQEKVEIADPDAVEAIVDLLEDGLTVEEIIELALCPAGNVEEQPEVQDQKTVAFIQTKQGHPLFNQRAMAEMEAKITIGDDRAKEILLGDMPDPNEAAVAKRDQITEWLNMVDGEVMPVASTDYHLIHRQTILEKLPPMIEAIKLVPEPGMVGMLKLVVPHYAEHVAMDMNLTEEEKTAEMENVALWTDAIAEADKVMQKLAEDAAKAGVNGGPGALPPPLPGAPLQATGPNGAIAGTNGDAERLALEAADKKAGHDLKSRELDLQERKLEHEIEKHAVDTSIQVAQSAAEQQAKALEKGIADADRERKEQNAQQNPHPPKV